MSNLSSRSAVLAALFAAAQLAACGGNDNNDPAPAAAPVAAPAPAPALVPAPVPAPTVTPPVTTISPLKALAYSVAGQADGTATAEAGQVSAPTTSGATLSLGAQGSIVLTVDNSNGFVITTPDYHVVNRYAGGVLMLCDAATTPGTTAARYVAVAASVAEGGVAPEALSSATALAGLRFFKLSDCAYQSGIGSQGQNTAADADTLFLEFDSAGNASSNAFAANYSATQFSDMLARGMNIPNDAGAQFAAYRFTIDGQPRSVIVERGRYDAADAASGFVRVWLPQ
jgi:hypothetical protein